MLGRLSRILVADDSDASRAATHQALRQLGYSMIDYVPDGYAALRLIAERNYSLVLADWETPRINGAEMLRQARLDRRLQCLPFLMVIPQWQRKFIEILRQDGATLYLTRPFTQEILHERMIAVDRDADLRSRQLRALEASARTVPQTSSALWRSLRPDACDAT